MNHEPTVVLSSLHTQAAREHLQAALHLPHRLAPLPRVCAEIADLVAQQVFDAARLERIIHSDAVLAGEVMRIANSPALRPRSPVLSLRQAVAWLGIAEIRNIAIAVMLRGEVFLAPGHEPESGELWREAWLASLWAQEIARMRRRHVESGFLAALMHRTGAALALKTLAGFEAGQRTVMDARSFAELVVQFETAFGRLLMKTWRLPSEVQDAASDWRDYQRSPQRDLAGAVHAAHVLATHTMYPQLLPEDIVLECPAFEHLGVLPEDRAALLARREQIKSVAGV